MKSIQRDATGEKTNQQLILESLGDYHDNVTAFLKRKEDPEDQAYFAKTVQIIDLIMNEGLKFHGYVYQGRYLVGISGENVYQQEAEAPMLGNIYGQAQSARLYYTLVSCYNKVMEKAA